MSKESFIIDGEAYTAEPFPSSPGFAEYAVWRSTDERIVGYVTLDWSSVAQDRSFSDIFHEKVADLVRAHTLPPPPPPTSKTVTVQFQGDECAPMAASAPEGKSESDNGEALHPLLAAEVERIVRSRTATLIKEIRDLESDGRTLRRNNAALAQQAQSCALEHLREISRLQEVVRNNESAIRGLKQIIKEEDVRVTNGTVRMIEEKDARIRELEEVVRNNESAIRGLGERVTAHSRIIAEKDGIILDGITRIRALEATIAHARPLLDNIIDESYVALRSQKHLLEKLKGEDAAKKA